MINKIFKTLGYSKEAGQDAERVKKEFPEMLEIYRLCSPYTMTSVERMYALYQSVRYVIKNNIPGDFVECGVWRGGSSMVIAATLKELGITNRRIWMFDTYEGMSEPTEADVDLTNKTAKDLLESNDKSADIWCLASLEDVQQNVAKTGYPMDMFQFIKGKVEDTLPGKVYFNTCALLRLDTDWYESTLIELKELYPKLSENGPLIIDDYGYWQGCRKAVDEYFNEQRIHILLNRIDVTGRIGIKNVSS